MKLEIGKYYRHKENDVYMAVVGKVNTTMWEEVLVGESPEASDALIPLDSEVEADEWEEVTEKDWLARFDEDPDEVTPDDVEPDEPEEE